MTGWTGTVIAVSLAIIALSILGVAAGATFLLFSLRETAEAFTTELKDVRREIKETMASIHRVGEKAGDILETVNLEVEEVVDTTRDLRRRITAGADRIGERVADIEALADVVQEEVEDTVVNVSTALRTVREGANVVGGLTRLVGRRDRGVA